MIREFNEEILNNNVAYEMNELIFEKRKENIN